MEAKTRKSENAREQLDATVLVQWSPTRSGWHGLVHDCNVIPNEVQFDSYTVQLQQHLRNNTIVYKRIDDL